MNSSSDAKAIIGAALRVGGVSLSYGSVGAVRGVDLDVQPGEFITLLGPSGSGKTSTLMMVAGFAYPDEGEIFLDGQELTNLPPNERGIGMVFQSYALFPHMTVEQNVGFPLKMKKKSKGEISARVAEVLEVVNLQGYQDRFPGQLSGGQQQRVALARAIVFNPPLLLMDEPLGALDKQLRLHLQVEIKRIQESLGLTVLYVTHDQEEALVMSDRIGVMDDGRLLQLGTPHELYDNPATEFVASFIGESNFLAGQVLQADNGYMSVDVGGQSILVPASAGSAAIGQVVIAVRPEKISLAPGGDLGGDMNLLLGVVSQRLFVGDAIRYKVDVLSGASLDIKQQRTATSRSCSVGEQVSVCWHKDDTRIFPQTAEASLAN
ncbi:ABC transporter ATP-binding protein [Nitratireductor sp. StC3]|uniref:ABC transporter ATP-binding protein n=1 Tax=Nitratireductor sp. StC3 TaxID=2126741 RepID=UPI000D0D3FE9|nr:ABC transporter ATP-binding protein [Nitratireductor sp. StC3]PSM15773.1 polyamine ABC transporter ATP-binding protein [Nitratireductor sp. StC3]